MKKLISITFVLLFMFSMIPTQVEAQLKQKELSLSESPCATGVSQVNSSWWTPSNGSTYTMCGCQIVSGTSASGSC